MIRSSQIVFDIYVVLVIELVLGQQRDNLYLNLVYFNDFFR